MRCPKCNDDIDSLRCVKKVTDDIFLAFDDQGLLWETRRCNQVSAGIKTYMCPFCDAVLFENEDDAFKFLKKGQ